MSKFEKLLDLLVNENKDDAEKLFHEIVVEKSREIYEGILAEDEKKEEEKAEDVAETEKASDKDEDAEVSETKEDDKEGEEVEETEEPAESTDETIEEIGGDATDDLLGDIEAEAHGMDMDAPADDEEGGMDHDGDFDDDGDQDGETEEMFEPLEKELDSLKAEFAKMMDKDDDKPEESLEVEESKDADQIVKEYADEVKKGIAAHSESGADNTKSPTAKGGKSYTSAGAHKIGDGAEETGGVGKKLTGDTAKDMGVSAKNEGGIKSAKLEKAPAPMTKEANADKTSPVAKK